MKKSVLIVTALLSTMLSSAQGSHSVECTADDPVLNKKGHRILPVKGDFAIGFNAIPVLDLLYNSIHIGGSAPTNTVVVPNTVQFVQGSNNQIVGKYFLDDKTAIRARVGINTLSGSMTNLVQDAEAMHAASLGTAEDIQAASLIRVEDKLKFTKSNIMVTVGIEKRRGYRRLQGYYGAEIGFGEMHANQNVTYGNAFSDVYAVQYTDNFNAFTVATQLPTSPRTVRNLSTKEQGGFRYGVRGFIGIEYFIFTKISIGVEYGWAYSLVTRRGFKATQEVFVNGQNGPHVFEEEVNIDNSEKTRGFAVDNNSGSVFSMNNTLGGNTALSGGAGAMMLIFHF